MKVDELGLLIMNLNSLVDAGRGNEITIDEAMEGAANETLWPLLKQRFSKELSWTGDANDPIALYLTDGWRRVHDAGPGIFGVSKMGVCLVLAWTAEMLKIGEGLEP